MYSYFAHGTWTFEIVSGGDPVRDAMRYFTCSSLEPAKARFTKRGSTVFPIPTLTLLRNPPLLLPYQWRTIKAGGKVGGSGVVANGSSYRDTSTNYGSGAPFASSSVRSPMACALGVKERDRWCAGRCLVRKSRTISREGALWHPRLPHREEGGDATAFRAEEHPTISCFHEFMSLMPHTTPLLIFQ